jgi:hypothetical protein
MIKILLLTVFLLAACHCDDECFDEHCPVEIANCNKDKKCPDILNECIDGCINSAQTIINWSCMALCAAPKGNAPANAVTLPRISSSSAPPNTATSEKLIASSTPSKTSSDNDLHPIIINPMTIAKPSL